MQRGIDYIGVGDSAESGWFALGAIPDDLTAITHLNLQHYRERAGTARTLASAPPDQADKSVS